MQPKSKMKKTGQLPLQLTQRQKLIERCTRIGAKLKNGHNSEAHAKLLIANVKSYLLKNQELTYPKVVQHRKTYYLEHEGNLRKLTLKERIAYYLLKDSKFNF